MNQLEKVRGAVLAYDKAVQHRNDAATALKEAENGLHSASKELVRVLGHTTVVTCDDVVL